MDKSQTDKKEKATKCLKIPIINRIYQKHTSTYQLVHWWFLHKS